MSIDLAAHYRAVLDDLRKRRNALATEIAQLDASIATIGRQAKGVLKSPLLPIPEPADEQRSVGNEGPGRFANMSVRWATLWVLAEARPAARKTAEVAQALLEGGYKTSMGERFGNSVSAVLSAMKSKGEIEVVVDAYRITPTGQSAWDHIKTTDRFKATQQVA
jgi:hypothetical protein